MSKWEHRVSNKDGFVWFYVPRDWMTVIWRHGPYLLTRTKGAKFENEIHRKTQVIMSQTLVLQMVAPNFPLSKAISGLVPHRTLHPAPCTPCTHAVLLDKNLNKQSSPFFSSWSFKTVVLMTDSRTNHFFNANVYFNWGVFFFFFCRGQGFYRT